MAEGALLVAEKREIADRAAHRLVIEGKTEVPRLEIDEVAVDEAVQRKVNDAELLDLLRLEGRSAEHGASLLLHRVVERAGVDLAVADRRHCGVDPALAEDIADTPDAE